MVVDTLVCHVLWAVFWMYVLQDIYIKAFRILAKNMEKKKGIY